jgi:hypothetical protein
LRNTSRHAVSFSVSRTLAHAQPFSRPVAYKITQSPSFGADRLAASLSNPKVAYTVSINYSIALAQIAIVEAQWATKLHTGQQVAFERKKLFPEFDTKRSVAST